MTGSANHRGGMMVRERLARRHAGDGDGFRWRGEEVSRVEGFSDAVFGFAVTLLVVSLEVPENFGELLTTMQGFFAFAISFALLAWIWSEHYTYFRRYGLRDAATLWINLVLLFLVLFFVYPLKFLFTLTIDELFGFGGIGRMIESSQYPLLLAIYGAGFFAVQVIFVVFYWRAYAMRASLGLNARELWVTRGEIQQFGLNASVCLASIAIVVVGGEAWASFAGWAYLLLFPLGVANGRLMESRWKKSAEG